MKIILVGLLISNFAMAGFIVPNIKWNQTEFNAKGSAIPWQQRNNISVALGNEKSDDKINDEEDKTRTTTVSGILAPTENLGLEIALGRSIYDYGNASSDDDEIGTSIVQGGYLVNSNLAIGAEVLVFEFDNNNSKSYANQSSVSATYNLGDKLYVGGGLGRLHINGFDLNPTILHGGIGFYEKDHMAAEAVILVQTSEEKGTATIDGSSSLILDGTYIYDRFQFNANIRIDRSKDDTQGDDEETVERNISLSGEYKLANEFFIGLSLERGTEDFEDNNNSANDSEAKSRANSIFARYRNEMFQAIVSVGNGAIEEDTNGSESQDDELSNFEVQLSYFF